MQDLKEIKFLRKKLGLTQTELAQRANVSQSLVAKVESGRLDPSYENARKIFEVLNQLESKNELMAKDIMYKKIIFISHNDDLETAIKKMKRYEISQLPVLKRNKVIGYVSESTLLSKILEGNGKDVMVKTIMEDAPPILPPTASKRVIVSLLKHFPLVLVSDEGKLKGIITKADLLRAIYAK